MFIGVKVNNWEKLFDDERLIRGYDYFLKDKVFDVILTDEYISSKVEGKKNKIYDVLIKYDKDEIKSLYCTCPYSYSDFNCKHMVATLYKKDEINLNKNKGVNINNDTYIFKDLLNDISEDKLKKYLYDTYNDNDEFKVKFINEFYSKFDDNDFEEYENILNNIFNIDLVELYNENGFYQQSPYQKYLLNFINSKIDSLYKNEYYEYVLKLIYSIYENIANKEGISDIINIDEIINACNYYMEKIIDLNITEYNNQIYEYILSNLTYNYNNLITPNLTKIAIKNNQSTPYLKDVDIAIDNVLNNTEDITDDLLVYKYVLMKKINYPLKEIDDFLYKYRTHYKIMDLLINKEIQENNINNAIELLKENREIHGKLYSLEDTTTLIDLYLFIDKKEEAISEIKNILFEYDVKDISYINQLKDLESKEDWVITRTSLIKYYEDNYEYEYLNKIYINENLYDDLYKNLINNCPLNNIETYRKYINEKYYDELLLIYKKAILKEAKTAKNISAYTNIINYLNIMLTYPDSIKTVEDTINILKHNYKNKPLFINKLNEIELK